MRVERLLARVPLAGVVDGEIVCSHPGERRVRELECGHAPQVVPAGGETVAQPGRGPARGTVAARGQGTASRLARDARHGDPQRDDDHGAHDEASEPRRPGAKLPPAPAPIEKRDGDAGRGEEDGRENERRPRSSQRLLQVHARVGAVHLEQPREREHGRRRDQQQREQRPRPVGHQHGVEHEREREGRERAPALGEQPELEQRSRGREEQAAGRPRRLPLRGEDGRRPEGKEEEPGVRIRVADRFREAAAEEAGLPAVPGRREEDPAAERRRCDGEHGEQERGLARPPAKAGEQRVDREEEQRPVRPVPGVALRIGPRDREEAPEGERGEERRRPDGGSRHAPDARRRHHRSEHEEDDGARIPGGRGVTAFVARPGEEDGDRDEPEDERGRCSVARTRRTVRRRPRILIVVTLAETGGAQTYVASLLPALVDEFEVVVAAHGPGPLREAVRRAGARFVRTRARPAAAEPVARSPRPAGARRAPAPRAPRRPAREQLQGRRARAPRRCPDRRADPDLHGPRLGVLRSHRPRLGAVQVGRAGAARR